MPNITISITQELYDQMKDIEDVNWSGVCRQAIKDYIYTYKNIITPYMKAKRAFIAGVK